MPDFRLGDVIDDYCVKCRRLTNHSIVSLLNSAAAKVRCRTCYSDHDYRNEQAPPSKKELLKQKELFNAVLAATVPADALPAVPMPEDGIPQEVDAPEVQPEDPPAPVKKTKKK
jgi:hypothetical protein